MKFFNRFLATTVTISNAGDGDPTTAMGKVLGILLTVAQFAGVALAIWGVVEFVMSLTQDMPEKKTKGVLMLAGGIMLIGVKPLINLLGVSIA